MVRDCIAYCICSSYYPITIGCSSIVRSDYGTENSNVAAVQIAMRYNHDDPMAREKSFMYGPSSGRCT